MKKTYQYRTAEWIDLTNPSVEELQEITQAYQIDEDIVEDLTSPSARHQVSFRDKHTYLVLHFPTFKDSDSDAAYELDFVVGENFVITVHYTQIRSLSGFATLLEKDEIPDAGKNDRNTLLFGILATLLNDFSQKLVEVDHWVRDLEKNMFAGKEKKTIFELSEASRHLIDFKKITAVYPDSFQELGEKGEKVFGKEFKTHALELLEMFNRDHTKLDVLAQAVKELRETNASILYTKQNQSMKTLTIVTVIATVLIGIALFWVGWQAL